MLLLLTLALLAPDLPGLHVISVGIDRYEDPRSYTLNYAKSDARALVDALRETREGPFSETLLLDENATRDNIRDAFVEAAKTASPDQTLVFYIAGLGYTLGGRAHLFPYDYIFPESFPNTENVSGREANAISLAELGSWLRLVPARRVVVIMDTFGEETALLEMKDQIADSDPLAQELTQRSLLILAARGVTPESSALSGGTVTHAIVTGLRGAADQNGDGRVSFAELERHYQHTLPVLHEQYGSASTPFTFLQGDAAVLGLTPEAQMLARQQAALEAREREAREREERAREAEARRAEQGSNAPPAPPPPPPPAAYLTAPVELAWTESVAVSGQINRAAFGEDVNVVFVNGVVALVDATGAFTALIPPVAEGDSVRVEALLSASSELRLVSHQPAPAELTRSRARNAKSAASARERTGRDVALFFATDTYEARDLWGNLRNPVHDATTIAKELATYYGFDTLVVRNPAHDDVLRALLGLRQREWNADDQLLIFFAGHGDFDEGYGDGFIVFRDAREDESGLRKNYLQHAQLRTMVDNLPVKHIALVLDVCYGGTFDQRISEADTRDRTTYEDASDARFIRRVLNRTSRLYLTSGGKEYVPDGRPGQHSPFASRLLAALRSSGGPNSDGLLTMAELKTYFEKLDPEPRAGGFGTNEVSSDFLFVLRGQ